MNLGQGGIPCPHCNTKIPTSMQELVTASKIVCPICRLELWINKSESQKAIDAMNKVLEAQNNLEKASLIVHFPATMDARWVSSARV